MYCLSEYWLIVITVAIYQDAPTLGSAAPSTIYNNQYERVSTVHTGSCKFLQIFATPGWRITSVYYSHQSGDDDSRV